MHLSRLPISLSEVTISSPRASAGVAIPTPNEAMNLPGVMRRMPSGVNEVVFVEGRFHDYAVDVARALRVDVVLSRAVLAEIYDWRAGRTPRGLGRAGSVLGVVAFRPAGHLRGPRLAHVSTTQLSRTASLGAPWRNVQ